MAFHETLGEWYDASQLSLYQLCPRRFYYRYQRHLTPNDSQSTDLSFGTAIHLALESLYLGEGLENVECKHRFDGDGDCPYHRPDGSTRRMFNIFLSNFPPHLEGRYKTQQNGLSLLAEYLRKWKSEPFKVIGVEQPFVIEVPGAEFKLCGKMDLIVDHQDDIIKICPLDHKTPGQISERSTAQYRFDLQVGIYIYAVVPADQNIRGMIINNLSPSKKNVDEKNLVRLFQTREQWDFDEMIPEIKQLVEQIHQSIQSGVWRKQSYACFAYNRECEYRSLCITPPEDREELMERMYKIETWEPF